MGHNLPPPPAPRSTIETPGRLQVKGAAPRNHGLGDSRRGEGDRARKGTGRVREEEEKREKGGLLLKSSLRTSSVLPLLWAAGGGWRGGSGERTVAGAV